MKKKSIYILIGIVIIGFLISVIFLKKDNTRENREDILINELDIVYDKKTSEALTNGTYTISNATYTLTDGEYILKTTDKYHEIGIVGVSAVGEVSHGGDFFVWLKEGRSDEDTSYHLNYAVLSATGRYIHKGESFLVSEEGDITPKSVVKNEDGTVTIQYLKKVAGGSPRGTEITINPTIFGADLTNE